MGFWFLNEMNQRWTKRCSNSLPNRISGGKWGNKRIGPLPKTSSNGSRLGDWRLTTPKLCGRGFRLRLEPVFHEVPSYIEVAFLLDCCLTESMVLFDAGAGDLSIHDR